MANPKGLEMNKNKVTAAPWEGAVRGSAGVTVPAGVQKTCGSGTVVFQWTWSVQAKSGLDDPRGLFPPSRCGMLGFIVLLGSAWFVKHLEYFQVLGSVVWNVSLMPMGQAGIWLRKVPKGSQSY